MIFKACRIRRAVIRARCAGNYHWNLNGKPKEDKFGFIFLMGAAA